MAISSEIRDVRTARRRPIRHGRGFLMEALVVMGFLMLALAVFARLFSAAQLEALHATRLSQAVQVATNYAEQFSANPASLPERASEGELLVTCEVEPASNGLVEATIAVWNPMGEELYTLKTARFVPSSAEATTTATQQDASQTEGGA